MRIDFAYIQAVEARARRERAEAMYGMLIAPLVALVKRLSTDHKGASGHAARAHFARQG